MVPTIKGAVFPIKVVTNSSSVALLPNPGVSAKFSSPTSKAETAPCSSTVTLTATGPAKPCTLVVPVSPSITTLLLLPPPNRPVKASLAPFITASEVTVAPAIISILLPASKGVVFPIKVEVKLSSFALEPKPSVSAKASPPTENSLMIPSSSRVTVTSIGPAKPCTVATAVFPTTLTFSGTSPTSPAAFKTNSPAWLAPLTTALLVMVAPLIASTSCLRTTGGCFSKNWLVKAASFAFEPRPAVSAKLFPPTDTPTISPSRLIPTMVSISPP